MGFDITLKFSTFCAKTCFNLDNYRTRLISTDEMHSKQYLRKHTFPFSTMFIEWNVHPRRHRDLFDMSTN